MSGGCKVSRLCACGGQGDTQLLGSFRDLEAVEKLATTLEAVKKLATTLEDANTTFIKVEYIQCHAFI